MRRLFPLNTGRTQITHIFSPRTPEEAIAEARCAEEDGADVLSYQEGVFKA